MVKKSEMEEARAVAVALAKAASNSLVTWSLAALLTAHGAAWAVLGYSACMSFNYYRELGCFEEHVLALGLAIENHKEE